MPTGEPLAALTQAALFLGDRERLERYYPKMLAFQGQFNDFIIDRLLGEIELLRGQLTSAEARLAAAEALARRESLPIDEAQVRWVHGNLAGIEFVHVEPTANLRLHGFVWDQMVQRVHTIQQHRATS